jgi:hypothetical protein
MIEPIRIPKRKSWIIVFARQDVLCCSLWSVGADFRHGYGGFVRPPKEGFA